jgi:putative ABC transport system permease protein
MTGFLVGLALKNLFRNVRRNVISGVAVIWGVALMILGYGFIDGLDENILRTEIDTLSGHVMLRPQGYPEASLSAPVDGLEAVPPELLASLQDYTWTQRLRFDVRLVSGPESIRALGVGFEPDRDPLVFPRNGYELKGEWPDQAGLVVGSRLARLLEVGPGDPVVLQVRTAAGSINALSFSVTGVVTSHNPAIDNYVVLLPLEQAMALVQAPGPSEIALRLPRRSQANQVAAQLDGAWASRTYMDAARDMIALNVARRKALGFLVLMIMAIAATGIANTVIMATYERVREVGALAAMGMTPNQVRTMFLLEGGALGLLAGTLGALLGAGANYYFSTAGVSLDALAESGSAVTFSTTLYSSFRWAPIAGGLAFGALVASLASIYPANHAANLDPAEAVRAD